MSVLATTHPTLLDVTKRLDPQGKIDMVAEMLHQTNEILDDAVWIEGNLETGHKTTVRTGLPVPTWRKLYGGVLPTKSTTAQVVETCGMLEAYAEVDKALADLNNNTKAFRLSEDSAFIEGINQELAQTTFYGNESSEPEAFTGFAPRFNSKSADNGGNIIGSTTDSDNASIWLVVWGPQTCFYIYPKGSKAGLQVNDKGQVTLENAPGGPTGGRMEAYRTHYRLDVGLCVRDWRYVVRIVLDQEDLVKDAATGPDLPDLMAQAIDAVPSLNMGRAAFYMNRRVRSFLRRQMQAAVKNSTLTQEMIGGRPIMMFDGIPVRRCDQLTNAEGAVA